MSSKRGKRVVPEQEAFISILRTAELLDSEFSRLLKRFFFGRGILVVAHPAWIALLVERNEILCRILLTSQGMVDQRTGRTVVVLNLVCRLTHDVQRLSGAGHGDIQQAQRFDHRAGGVCSECLLPVIGEKMP